MSAEPLFEGFASDTPEPAKVTERDVLDALRRRYTKQAGNGQRYVLAEHVRDTGAFARRTADLIVRDVWDSSRHALHGFEVKVSRSDWLTELKDPTKAERFRIHCDYWWLAVSDASIVRDDLPDGWGLLVMAGDTMRTRVKAPRNEAPVPMESGMRTSLDRSIAKTARRHLILDIETGRRPICERYVSPYTCFDVATRASLCWSCRAAVIAGFDPQHHPADEVARDHDNERDADLADNGDIETWREI